ncbi:MAG: AMP-binding protein [Gammaproteobacteria bacterium]
MNKPAVETAMPFTVLQSLRELARQDPQRPLLFGSGEPWSALGLFANVESLAQQLRSSGAVVVASRMDNSPAWVAMDLACIEAGVVHVPIPPFFSPRQIEHALSDAGVTHVFSDRPSTDAEETDLAGLWLQRIKQGGKRSRGTIAKLTYTSGSTAEPKAVRLGLQGMERVAASLLDACAMTANDRHVVLMPLAVLLENIAGIYTPLLSGASIVIPSLAEVGLGGPSGIDGARMIKTLSEHQATTAITTPHTLMAMLDALEAGAKRPELLRFLAVGGAPISPAVIQRALDLGLPVFQGYGLSECNSVLTLNTAGHNRLGSVGRPLGHASVKIADNGEILAAGALFLGYGDESANTDTDTKTQVWYHTGDLGRLDADGYLWITGRLKHAYATAEGRNVSPEWVERELCAQPGIAQAAVFGEARPSNCALIFAHPNADVGADADAVKLAIERVNAELPAYARVGHYLVLDEPFSVNNGQLTGTGRPRRAAIEAAYAEAIESFYSPANHLREQPIHDTL